MFKLFFIILKAKYTTIYTIWIWKTNYIINLLKISLVHIHRYKINILDVK